jgi:peptidoglycan glycosyltransferase
MVLFALLLINANWIQMFGASQYEDNPYNRRKVYEAYSKERGRILAGNETIALSRPTTNPKDPLKYVRVYPEAQMYAPVTGFDSTLGGQSGIEQAEREALDGTDGRFFVRNVLDILTGKGSRGGNVKTTIIPAAQEAAFNAMQGKRGAVVAIEPTTGKILAMVSLPSYNPNAFASHDLAEVIATDKQLQADPAKPTLNRALSEAYPPGSTFKVVTAAAALSSGKFDPNTPLPAAVPLPLPGTVNPLVNYSDSIPCDGANMTTGLQYSCNTTFGYIAMQLGMDALNEQARKFGMYQTDLTVPMPVSESVLTRRDLDRAQTARTGIGQEDVSVTPLQMAMIAAGIANNGKVMKPYLVDEIRSPDLSVIDKTSPELLSRALSPSVARQLSEMMVNVVENGTGSNARIPGVQVGGKTGTAQRGVGNALKPYAWFISFASVDNDPKVAVAVVIEDAGDAVARGDIGGGALAAPVGRAVMQAVLNS